MPAAYLALARERAATTFHPYKQPEEFGYDFREWVSPYTKGAHVLGTVALVLQDWASEDGLSCSTNPEIQAHGRLPRLRTNQTLETLLRTVLCRSLSDVYATNAFPFVKPGGMSGSLRKSDVLAVAHRFLHREIEIARPSLVLALGAVASYALQAIGVECVRLPHPAARLGSIAAHQKSWRAALKQAPR